MGAPYIYIYIYDISRLMVNLVDEPLGEIAVRILRGG